MAHTWPSWLGGGSKACTWPGWWLAEFLPMDLPMWAHQEGPTRAWMHNTNHPNSQGHCRRPEWLPEETKESILFSPQDWARAPSPSPVPAYHAHWASLLSPAEPWAPWTAVNSVPSLSTNPKLSEKTHRYRIRDTAEPFQGRNGK